MAGPNSNSGGASVVNNTIITEVNGGGTTTNNTKPSIQTASLTTPVLNSGNYSFSTLTLSKAFVLLSISVSAPARLRLYATPCAQTPDVLRSDGTASNFETTQGVSADVTIDSPPWTWLMSPAPNVSNGDFPQTANCYVAVNNDDAVSASFTISLQYVKLA